MIVGKIMGWLFPRHFKSDAEAHLDETIRSSLRAIEKVSDAAEMVNKAAERNQAIMENVTFDSLKRVEASEERRGQKPKYGTEAAMRGLLGELNRGKPKS